MASSITAAGAVTKEGYMVKKGHLRKNWKRRFFSLTPQNLAYFKKAGGKAKGIYSLLGSSVRECTSMDNNPFVFELKLRNGKCLHCSCTTDYERKEWVDAILTNIQSLKNAMETGYFEKKSNTTHKEQKRRNISVYTSSWNMGEKSTFTVAEAENWIPRGYDVYGIGVQECLVTDSVKKALHAHLGDEYAIIDHGIGNNATALGYHGFIYLTVFVRTALVTEGICLCAKASKNSVSLGTRLLFTRATNKGAVSITLPLKLPDDRGKLRLRSSLCFVSCHLASDRKTESKLSSRNADAKAMLENLCMEFPRYICNKTAENYSKDSLEASENGDDSVQRKERERSQNRIAFNNDEYANESVRTGDSSSADFLSLSRSPKLLKLLDKLLVKPQSTTLATRTVDSRVECETEQERRKQSFVEFSNCGSILANNHGSRVSLRLRSADQKASEGINRAIEAALRRMLPLDRRQTISKKRFKSMNEAMLHGSTAKPNSVLVDRRLERLLQFEAQSSKGDASNSPSMSPKGSDKMPRRMSRFSSRYATSFHGRSIAFETDTNLLDTIDDVVANVLSKKYSAMENVVNRATEAAQNIPRDKRNLLVAELSTSVSQGALSLAVMNGAAVHSVRMSSFGRSNEMARLRENRIPAISGIRRSRSFSEISSLVTGKSSPRNETNGSPIRRSASGKNVTANGQIEEETPSRLERFRRRFHKESSPDAAPNNGPATPEGQATPDNEYNPRRSYTTPSKYPPNRHDSYKDVLTPLIEQNCSSYVFIIGDLNYRVRMTPEQAVYMVAKSEQLTEQYTGDFNARPSTAEASILQKYWERLLTFDELRNMFDSSSLFLGFEEAPIAFPPTYKRRKAMESWLRRKNGDYANVNRLQQGFTTDFITSIDEASTDPNGLEEGVNEDTDSDSDNNEGKYIRVQRVHSEHKGTLANHAAALDSEVRHDKSLGSPKENRKKKSGAARTPSYPDRILFRRPLQQQSLLVSTQVKDPWKHSNRNNSAVLRQTAAVPLDKPKVDTNGEMARGRVVSLPRSKGSSGYPSTLPSLQCISYNTSDDVTGSDHIPVYACFQLSLDHLSGKPDLQETERNSVCVGGAVADQLVDTLLSSASSMIPKQFCNPGQLRQLLLKNGTADLHAPEQLSIPHSIDQDTCAGEVVHTEDIPNGEKHAPDVTPSNENAARFSDTESDNSDAATEDTDTGGQQAEKDGEWSPGADNPNTNLSTAIDKDESIQRCIRALDEISDSSSLSSTADIPSSFQRLAFPVLRKRNNLLESNNTSASAISCDEMTPKEVICQADPHILYNALLTKVWSYSKNRIEGGVEEPGRLPGRNSYFVLEEDSPPSKNVKWLHHEDTPAFTLAVQNRQKAIQEAFQRQHRGRRVRRSTRRRRASLTGDVTDTNNCEVESSVGSVTGTESVLETPGKSVVMSEGVSPPRNFSLGPSVLHDAGFLGTRTTSGEETAGYSAASTSVMESPTMPSRDSSPLIQSPPTNVRQLIGEWRTREAAFRRRT
eukprot:gb/GECG01010532.1/.p1 GENE.gb/GECG01010532.1/~~gb/GECG01010532.1/.p1  ORF type:complete len:1508 (+),score=240.78 gb/GECG01010532.1/:1-4524(+)